MARTVVTYDGGAFDADGTPLSILDADVTEDELDLSDVTTADTSTTMHGLAPKLSGDASQYLDGTGDFSSPAGAAPGGGASARIYSYEVSGVDKASIDTAVDGSTVANFAGYDVLEFWLIGRTDEAVRLSIIAWTFNNDTGANYDRAFVATSVTGTTPTGDMAAAGTAFQLTLAGANQAANVSGICRVTVPNYLGTSFYKNAEVNMGTVDTAAANANRQVAIQILQYRSTSAISRIAVTPNTGGAKFKVGSRLIVYGR